MDYPPPRMLLIAAIAVLAIASNGCRRTGESQDSNGVPTVEPEKPPVTRVKVPNWVPIYPGSVLASDVQITRTPQELDFDFDFSTRDKCNVVLSWYQNKLRNLGFFWGGMAVHTSAPICMYADDSPDAANGNMGQFQAQSADYQRSLTVSWGRRAIPQGNSEKVMNLIIFRAVETNHGRQPETSEGGAIPKIPDWAPVYPGSAPTMMAATQTSQGTMIPFEFSTKFTNYDSCSKVIDWYQQQLQSKGFRTFNRKDARQPQIEAACDSSISAEGSQGRSLQVRAQSQGPGIHVDVETLQK
jgi:hypothetical protein